MRNKNTTGFLALLLGGVGIHHFYLGNYGTGVIYILLCWTGLPAIVAIFEAIKFFTMDKEKFDKEYNLEAMIKQKQYEQLQSE